MEDVGRDCVFMDRDMVSNKDWLGLYISLVDGGVLGYL